MTGQAQDQQEVEMAVETMARPGRCAHPAISDEQLHETEARRQSFGSSDVVVCPDCSEYLYPYETGDGWTVATGEPFGAGDDYWGRPAASVAPEYWTE